MNSLITQFQVPPAEARQTAEPLIAGRFVDPLGGEYSLVDPLDATGAAGDQPLPAPGARRLWASTAATPANRFLLTEIPADYRMPLMNWFRGMNVEVARDDALDAVTLHAELDMAHLEVAPDDADDGFSLPSLGGWLSGMSGTADEE